MKESNLEQAKMATFECIEVSNPTLLALVKQAAESTHTPTPPLVQLARKTLSILEDTHAQHPDLQDLAHHAVKIVGLLCRVGSEKEEGAYFRRLVEDLTPLLLNIANHINTTEFADETVTRASCEQLQCLFMEVLFHIVRQDSHKEMLVESGQEDVNSHLSYAHSNPLQEAARDQPTPVNNSSTPGTHAYPNTITVPPTSVHHLGNFPISGYPPPYHIDPLTPFAPGFPVYYPPSYLIPAYPCPFLPPPGISNTNNSGNVQNIVIANNHHYFTPPRRTSHLQRRRPRETSILDQLRLAQDVTQAISPPFWYSPPHPAATAFAGRSTDGAGLRFSAPPPTPYSAFIPTASSPTPYLPPSPSSLGSGNVQNVGTGSSASKARRYTCTR
ncbi:unnamed protein product [Cyclocybe aegerita]|uniref:Uncharacterized protein n=1 Tax=Cyclocybe aegerita TaxID=1973307 RepID=A0A8S0XYI6_CYCAE|nr:unnamed protein product [Cyclocybe aegerita]